MRFSMKMVFAPDPDLTYSLSALSQQFDTLVQNIEQSVTSIDF
jgi:hypothetical protein